MRPNCILIIAALSYGERCEGRIHCSKALMVPQESQLRSLGGSTMGGAGDTGVCSFGGLIATKCARTAMYSIEQHAEQW